MKQAVVPKSDRQAGSAPKRTNPKTPSGRARKRLKIRNDLPGAKFAVLPHRVDAKLATLLKDAPVGDQWFHEIKFGGYRMLCRIDHGKVEIFSRNQKNWTEQLPTLVVSAAKLPVSQAILDGELVSFEENGVSNFQSLQNNGRTAMR